MSQQYNDPLEGQAFDQVNNILDDNEADEHEVCHFKISQLQKIVATLTRTNERLIMRIEQLEEQAEKRQKLEESVFNEEYSVLQCDFGDVEDMIKEYKKELEQYKQKIRGQITEQSKITEQLRDQNEQLRKANIDLRNEVDQLKSQMEMLENTKEGLLTEIEELQSSLRKSKYEGPKYSINRYLDYDDYSTGSSGDFNTNVQYELEKLIQKLVKQLEHERHMKKKLMEEIKQLQRDILEQEKQIITKNNKIYSLEINAIKSSKIDKIDRQVRSNRFKASSPEPVRQAPRVQKARNEPARKRTFTLMQLMNECVVLTVKEKLVLSLKLIDLYSKKYQNNDFSSQILESLVVSNYNQNNPHLCQVKVDPSIEKDQDHQSENEQELVWNLIFILDNLLSQTSTRDRELGQYGSEDALLEAVGYFLENKEESNIEAVIQLRKIVEESLTGLMR